MSDPSHLEPSFFAPRACFTALPPEAEEAIDLLDRAADAVLVDDNGLAASLIKAADMPALWDYFQLVAAKSSEEIHRFREVPDAPPRGNGAGPRMPTAKAIDAIYARDGWRCRFCGVRVISPRAALSLNRRFPAEARLGRRNAEQHTAFLTLRASCDHVLPFQRGGTSEEENMVTACQVCQFGRNVWTLAEVGFSDPRGRSPRVDSWDGLTRLL